MNGSRRAGNIYLYFCEIKFNLSVYQAISNVKRLVSGILALRNILCSDRWAQEWPLIAQRLRQQTRILQAALRAKHGTAKTLPVAA
jgi:hypothetical protein